ncbi:hypothetical protein MLD38_016456 [Melastoma candidum]|uniref:Uncharacterized protein n=1 Tax=Melastoma candidum TaxID=119954 RepID=A0ACB9QMH7_9MYRT|nr:hypothetical protein MLD38_016456 [Melastoma candidum]
MKASSSSSSRAPRKKLNLQSKGSCGTSFCCGCRLSISSSEEADSVSSGRFGGISTLAHAMVQERLDQMIRERQEERRRERQGMRKHKSVAKHGTKFVVMMAMEKNSYDPRRDFQESVLKMITMNKIRDAKDLRCLLNYYISLNSDEYRGLILEVFHDVCRSLFLGYDSC